MRRGVPRCAGDAAAGVAARAAHNWSSPMLPWKMSPPVSPNVRSRSSGDSAVIPTMLARKFGAAAVTLSMIAAAAASAAAAARSSSQLRPSGRTGENCCANRLATCMPGGASPGSTVDGIVMSATIFGRSRLTVQLATELRKPGANSSVTAAPPTTPRASTTRPFSPARAR